MPPKPRPHGRKPPPKRRPHGPAGGLDRRAMVLVAVAGAVVVAAIVGAVVAFGGGGSSADVRTALEEAGCTLTVKPAVENVSDHSDFPNPDARSPKWNTDPPTSGPHYGQTITYGAYTEPLQIGRLVHNLEHGAVFILYGDDVPGRTVEQLRSFYGNHTRGTVLAPYPRLGATTALGAWYARGLDEAKSVRGSGVLATCPGFDENAFAAFLSSYQFKGPEAFPPDSLLPGRN